MATVSGVASGLMGSYLSAIGSGTTSNASALMTLDIVVNSSGVTAQDHRLPLFITMGAEFAVSGEFYSSISVQRTNNTDFGARIRVGEEVPIPSGDIGAVLVNGSGATELDSFDYSSASGLIVTVSGSYSGLKNIHNASIDFSEGINSYSGGLTVTSGVFSASHVYSYGGIYNITTRVQDVDGVVNMEKFRLNLASGLSASDLGALSGSATPESGLITSESYLPVSFSSSGASGVSLSSPSDGLLWWRFGNNGRSQKVNPSGNYAQPGNYIAICSYLYSGPSGSVYLTDSIETGFNV